MPGVSLTCLSPFARRLCTLAVYFTVAIPCFGLAQSTDEIAVRAVLDRFLAAYQSRDLNGLMMLWSEKSPDVAANRQSFQEGFASKTQLQVKGVTVRRITATGRNAAVRFTLDLVPVEASTGASARDSEKMNRTIHLVNEEGVWKISRYVPTEEEIADELVELPAEQRESLLDREKDFVNAKLVEAIITRCQGLYDKGNGQRALPLYQLAVELAMRLGDRAAAARAMRGVGAINSDQGNLTEALRFYEQCLQIGQELGDKRITVRAIGDIGRIQSNMGDYKNALVSHLQSRAIAEELGDRRGIAVALLNTGMVYGYQGANTAALEHLNQGLSIARDLRDNGLVLTALNLIGSLQQEQGNYPDALERFDEALGLAKEAGNKRFTAILMNNLANLYTASGNYTRAMEHGQKGLALAEEIAFKRLMPTLLIIMGNLHYYQGNFAQA